MRKLLIATGNKGKLEEFKHLLGTHFECFSPSDFSHIKEPLIVENGTTYQENALLKAEGFLKAYQLPVLSDDSGLEVEALDGKPGLFSARFGGEGLTWQERWEYLYAQMAQNSSNSIRAQFRCVLCFLSPKSSPQFFEGLALGQILPAPKGGKGFGYDPIFYSSELKMSFGEASFEDKQRASHRAHAVRAFLHSLA